MIINNFLNTNNLNSRQYLFIDEVQNLPNWELFIVRIQLEYNVKIFLTGSNSKPLSSDIATQLRGRTIQQELLPPNFVGFVKFADYKHKIDHSYNAQDLEDFQRLSLKKIHNQNQEFYKNIIIYCYSKIF